VKTELVVHFLKLDIESRSFDLVPWVQRLFASNDLTSRFPAQARQLRICLERADSAFALPIPAMTDGAFAETHLGLGPCYYAAGRFHSWNDGHLWHEMDYAFDTDTLRANLGGHYVQSPQSVITYVLRPILKGFLMPFYRLASVHAAGLAAGERTLLLAGAPAAGKSTAAIQLMFAGYELLSDDRMFVTLDGDAACALSSLDFLHVTDATLRMFPALRAHVVGERDESDKWAVAPPRRADDAAWRTPRRVTDFIQLRRGPVARPRLAKLERGLALQDLLRETMIVFRSRPFRSAPYPFAQYSDFILTVVAALVRDARTYVLEFADHDLPRLPALLDAVRAG
jgi:hypothetical protein